MKKATKKPPKISKKMLDTAVTRSARLEGLSFARAKKNKTAIKLLKHYGRAFSV